MEVDDGSAAALCAPHARRVTLSGASRGSRSLTFSYFSRLNLIGVTASPPAAAASLRLLGGGGARGARGARGVRSPPRRLSLDEILSRISAPLPAASFSLPTASPKPLLSAAPGRDDSFLLGASAASSARGST